MNKRFFRRQTSYRSGLVSSKTPLYVGGAVVLLAVVGIVRILAPSFLTQISLPLWKGGTVLSAAVENANVLQSRSALIQERDTNAEENASLTSQNAALISQVADLTALLGTRTSPQKGIIARVIAHPPMMPYDILVIDQGSDAGVTSGALASGNGGTPVGLVSEVSTGESRITAYSSRGVSSSGWVGSEHLTVTLTGAGAGAFTSTVPKEAGIAVGDAVYVVGNSSYPIGSITNIERDPSSPSVVLDIRPYANPFSLTLVTISK